MRIPTEVQELSEVEIKKAREIKAIWAQKVAQEQATIEAVWLFADALNALESPMKEEVISALKQDTEAFLKPLVEAHPEEYGIFLEELLTHEGFLHPNLIERAFNDPEGPILHNLNNTMLPGVWQRFAYKYRKEFKPSAETLAVVARIKVTPEQE